MTYEMYQEQILDHYKNPRNRGDLHNPDLSARDSNPLCGDELTLHLKVDSDGKVSDVKFNGQGCAISQASASMLTVMVKGKTLNEVKEIDKDKIVKTLGIPLSPIRLKCALLSLQVLKKAIFSKEILEEN